MRVLRSIVLTALLLTGFSFRASHVIELVKIRTDYGDILVYLYDQTPQHKANFLKLAKSGFYNGTLFHRVIPDFMIQGGDPNSKDSTKTNLGDGGPGYNIPAEFVPNIYHKYGALAAAREGDQVNPKKESSGSQFYIVKGKKFSTADMNMMEQHRGMKFNDDQRKIYSTIGGAPFLDSSYTVFGEVVSGMDVVEKIIVQPRDRNDRPYKNIAMGMEIVKTTASSIAKDYPDFHPQVEISEK